MPLPATLVIRPEKLGDLVISTPVFKALKEQYPDAPLHVLTDTNFAEVVKGDPHVDRIIAIRWTGRHRGERESWLDIYRRLRGTKYARAAILYFNVEAWNWMMLALGVRDVAQLGGTYSAILLRQKMVLRKGHRDRSLHFSRWYLKVAEALGAAVHDTQPRLYLHEDETNAFRDRHPILGEPGPKIILHPFNHGTSPNYSLASYIELAKLLSAIPGVRIFITGSPSEAARFPELPETNVDRSLLGKISVREWIIASTLVDLVISGATGVIHAGAAAGSQILALYCPESGGHPTLWGPLGPHAQCIIAPESYCKKIGPVSSTCTGNNTCNLAGGIPPCQVAAKAAAILAGREISGSGSAVGLIQTNP